jgi:hypothetical protein
MLILLYLKNGMRNTGIAPTIDALSSLSKKALHLPDAC